MTTVKNERITARVSEQAKTTLTVAADMMGATLNQFLIQAALEKAEQIIEKNNMIHLSQQDTQLFFDALDNPPEPTAALKKSFVNYQRKIE